MSRPDRQGHGLSGSCPPPPPRAGDYGVIDNSVQFPGASGYFNGDFNFDGVIDAADYGIIDNTIQLQGPPL